MDSNLLSPTLGTSALPWWRRRRWPLLALAVWLLATLGWRPLTLPDEGRYAEVAREMLLGDAWLPTLYGLPFFHKPPLMYWLDVAAMQLLGVSAFAARFAPAFGAWLMGAALYLDLVRRAGPREAAIALGILATCPFFFFGAQYANHDMLVAGLITAAIICAQRAVDDSRNTEVRWVVAAWCAMAFALLAKGLIGVVLPALVVVPWLLWQRRWREVLRLGNPLAVLAFAVIALPWFVAMQWRFPDFFDYFVLEQHFRRYAQTHFNNAQPFWFFVAVFPLLTLPWSLWLPAVLRRWRGRAAPGPVAVRNALGLQPGLCAWWVLAVVGFFSLPSSKLVGYVLPALAPLAALLAMAVWSGRAWRWVMPAAALFCLAALAGFVWKAPESQRSVGLALGAQLQPGDRVVFVNAPFFDVPFYAGLKQPPFVLSDWDDPAIASQDNWRKELSDAGRFDRQGAAQRLVSAAQVGAMLCSPRTLWFVASKGWQVPAALGELTLVLAGPNGDLLRASGGTRSGCQ
jgi:4-amino-4-deoxy-L-arabinose transferase-like glycosyltransferase